MNGQHEPEKCENRFLIKELDKTLELNMSNVTDKLEDIGSKVDKVIDSLSNQKAIVTTINTISTQLTDLIKTNRDDHSAIHSKFEAKYQSLELKTEAKIHEFAGKYEAKIDIIEKKSEKYIAKEDLKWIISIVGFIFTVITFIINYIPK